MKYDELKQKMIDMRAISFKNRNVDVETSDEMFGIGGYKNFELFISPKNRGDFLMLQRGEEWYAYDYRHTIDLMRSNSPFNKVSLNVISIEDKDGIINQVLQDYAESSALKVK